MGTHKRSALTESSEEPRRNSACAHTQHYNGKVSQGQYVSMSMSTSLALIIVSARFVNSKYGAYRVCHSKSQYYTYWLPHSAESEKNENEAQLVLLR